MQKGNAPEERKIQRLFRDEKVARLIKRCNDFGAGGVSVAIGELADSLEINLDAVPKKYEGLDGTDLAISESQERMAVVVAPENIDLFIKYAKKENLEATLVARVTDTGRLTMHWRGQKIVDLSREFLSSNGAPKYTKVEVPLNNVNSEDLGFTYFRIPQIIRLRKPPKPKQPKPKRTKQKRLKPVQPKPKLRETVPVKRTGSLTPFQSSLIQLWSSSAPLSKNWLRI